MDRGHNKGTTTIYSHLSKVTTKEIFDFTVAGAKTLPRRRSLFAWSLFSGTPESLRLESLRLEEKKRMRWSAEAGTSSSPGVSSPGFFGAAEGDSFCSRVRVMEEKLGNLGF
ncbi:unnamed protein product [Linum trigynum]|uniref:Uncharacterized protein n=1 Tax=Linum trigynum TaxID=586398 RepID=A0AAV2CV85_9ROSI